MITFATLVELGESEPGVRLEVAGGITTWEAFPGYRHQKAVDRIRAGIRCTVNSTSGYPCVCATSVYVRFPEGSLKRPDIAMFCREPDELDEAITMLPEAVIEVLSPGYEAKDLTIGVPFYLRSGIKNIIVFDPETNEVRHFRPRESERRSTSPTTIALACGCEVTV